MKCFALWFNDDGTAKVAQLSPEQGESLLSEVDAKDAASPEEAVDLMVQMVAEEEGESETAGEEEEVMRGYMGGEKKPMMSQGKMTPGKVFGDE